MATNIQPVSVFEGEAEYLFQPFTFYKITNIDINLDAHEATMDMQLYFRKEILEKKIQKGGHISIDDDFKLL